MPILRIVIASPSDVQIERDLFDEIAAELNRGIAKNCGLHIEFSRWETEAFPGFHIEGPQGLIDSVLRIDDCDLLIGIFWKRFGTPTTDARSGTEHEFLKALEAWKRNKRPQIMFYFNQQPYAPKTKSETDQWGQVLEFKERFPQEGLYWSYNTITEFEKLVRQHLTHYILLMPTNGSLSSKKENYLSRSMEMQGDREKTVREILEELYQLSNQINIWIHVNLRYLYKELDKTDYYRTVIPKEYTEDVTKEPECPIDRLEMLISFDAPSLGKYLPEYKFIVSEMREVRYIYDTHQSLDTLNYYFWGITYSEYEKMSGRQVNTIEEFLQYITVSFPKLHDDFRITLSKLAQTG